MIEISDITKLLDAELRIDEFEDSSLNGLQVEGSPTVTSIAVAVDAGELTIENAIAAKAQLLIVHHGLFWGQAQAITGSRHRIIKQLLDNGLNLYAAHLPLDAHMTLGNNFALAAHLELKEITAAFHYRKSAIGCLANGNNKPLQSYVTSLETLPGNSPILLLPFGPQIPKRIGIVSGAAMDHLREWKDLGFDTFITGEPRQSAYHFARENRLNVICAGHYRSETLGVQNLGKLLLEKFNTPWNFIDVPTGI